MSEEKRFRVEWCMDIYAASAEEAARKALAYQRDPESTATCFEIWGVDEDNNDCTHSFVDLTEIDERAAS